MIECQKKTLLYIGILTYYEWMNECIYKIIDDMIYESSLKLNEISNKQSKQTFCNAILKYCHDYFQKEFQKVPVQK